MSTAIAKHPTSDVIEKRIDRPIAGAIELSGRRGLVLQSMGEALEFAKLMALGRESPAGISHISSSPAKRLLSRRPSSRF